MHGEKEPSASGLCYHGMRPFQRRGHNSHPKKRNKQYKTLEYNIIFRPLMAKQGPETHNERRRRRGTSSNADTCVGCDAIAMTERGRERERDRRDGHGSDWTYLGIPRCGIEADNYRRSRVRI